MTVNGIDKKAIEKRGRKSGRKRILAAVLAVLMVFAGIPMIPGAGSMLASAESQDSAQSMENTANTGSNQAQVTVDEKDGIVSGTDRASISAHDLPEDSEAVQDGKFTNGDILLEKFMLQQTAEADNSIRPITVRRAAKSAAMKTASAGTQADSTLCLSDNSKRLYNNLKSKIKKIANGTVSSSKITIDHVESGYDSSKPMIKSEYTLGEYNTFVVKRNNRNTLYPEKLLAVNDLDLERVVKALLADLPYDFYWFDITAGYNYNMGSGLKLSTNSNDNKVISNIQLTVNMRVSADYSSTGATGTFDLNSSKVNRAKNAASTAAAWVREANSKYSKDYQKLLLFRKKICSAVAYNSNYASAKYGDVWQMVNVFDGSSGTNVVCEGYSKAFRYLCDCAGIECLMVTGTMSGGTGAGDHMWNVVRLGSSNYLVDVTNCDTGTVGEPNKLFLKGRSDSQTATNIYIIEGKWGQGTTRITFRYDEETKKINSPFQNSGDINARLRLADKDFSYPEATAEMREFATAELGKVVLSDYSGSELTKVNQLIKTAKSQIAAASSISAVNSAVKKFKAAMAQVKTNLQKQREGSSVGSAKSGGATITVTTKAAFQKKILIAANKKVKKFKVRAKKKRKAVISWKPVSGVTGYEIIYSTKTNFSKAKKVVVKGAKKKKYTIKKLKAKKNYYIGIRPYTVIVYTKGYSVKQCGKWGNAKRFKAKK